MTTSIEGTQLFLAPECLSFDVQSFSMRKADVWSLGVTLYCLTFYKMPFPIGDCVISMMDNIINCEVSFEGRHLSEEFKEFLSMMLEKDPEARASVSDLKKTSFYNKDYSVEVEILKRRREIESQMA
jgi:serine/threonine protein kinase